MKQKLQLLGILSALPAMAAWGAWDDSYDPLSEPSYADGAAYSSEETLTFEEPLGVDPIYSTPSAATEPSGRSRTFAPNFYLEYLGKMSISGQSARTQVTNAFFAVPLTRRPAWGRWHFDAKASGRVTWVNTCGHDVIDEDTLYTLGLHAALSYQATANSSVQLGFTPQLSSDLDVMSSQNFYWGGYAAFSAKYSSHLSYTAGLALMPDYYDHYVFPVFSLDWRCAPAWELQVQASRISMVNVASERFHWGPFFQWNAGIWTVHRHGRTQQLRMTNCIAGIGTSYDARLRSGTTLHFVGDVGTAFYNTFRVRDKHGDHTLERYRTHPGWYARLGVQVRF